MLVDALNEMKRRSGKTLVQISEECKIPKGTLNKVFAGQTKDPQYETLKNIVHSLGFKLDDLDIIGTPEEENSPVTAAAETREISAEHIMDVFVSAGIMPAGQDLTDEDLLFLRSIASAVFTWFQERHQTG